MPNGQQRNFIIEIDEAFDDHAPLPRSATGLGIFPGVDEISLIAQNRLPLARGAHDRLDQTGKAERRDR